MYETIFTFGLYDALPPTAVWAGVALAFILFRAMEARGQILVVYRGGGKSALHQASFQRETPVYALLYLTGLPVLFCLGVQLIGALAFQLQLNAELGEGLLDESDAWTLFGRTIPKPFAGGRRPLQLIFALILLAPYLYL